MSQASSGFTPRRGTPILYERFVLSALARCIREKYQVSVPFAFTRFLSLR